jgi:hypothetical protein
MSTHFFGIRISVENILNPVIIVSLIISLLDLLKNVFLTRKRHQVEI